jgi:leucyl aminopeptidase
MAGEARGAIARVEFLVDGAVRGTVAAAPFAFAWETAGEAPGAHQLVVRVVGTDGKLAQSPPVSVTVAPPGAAVSSASTS